VVLLEGVLEVVEVVLVVPEVVPKPVPRLLLSRIATLEFILPAVKKICFAPRTWCLEKVFTEKRELALMFVDLQLKQFRTLTEPKLNIVFGILSVPRLLLVSWAA
jgi:hypothetical protein